MRAANNVLIHIKFFRFYSLSISMTIAENDRATGNIDEDTLSSRAGNDIIRGLDDEGNMNAGNENDLITVWGVIS
ncbi:MAG: hypothetical protein EBW73_05255 [Betaproteobacteria bacterium]|nr:hypothetical protein [Betaproteobacteria bacterium]NCW19890.1 hypothetical protein [Betaproteobacteria bacterium]NCW34276.1 hypothetical protein [Betaproteobacteria bacterium]NCW50682.1 hypothetical protein [Betaproteobacteria bacterium]NCX12222.1 hypothetical protein [Betaproteobacteria bacterium]